MTLTFQKRGKIFEYKLSHYYFYMDLIESRLYSCSRNKKFRFSLDLTSEKFQDFLARMYYELYQPRDFELIDMGAYRNIGFSYSLGEMVYDDKRFYVITAVSPKDQFSRKKGRKIIEKRLSTLIDIYEGFNKSDLYRIGAGFPLKNNKYPQWADIIPR